MTLPILQKRGCGSCTACCVALPILVLKKPAGVACKNLHSAAETLTGCSIYSERPVECSNFECVWVRDAAAEALEVRGLRFRPDQCGVLFHIAGGGMPPNTIIATEMRFGASHQGDGGKMLRKLAKNYLVMVMRDNNLNRVEGPPAKQHQLARVLATIAAQKVNAA
jgi:hypothetical protein